MLSNHWDLLCPGLLGPIPAFPEPMPRALSLARCLARADQGVDSGQAPENALLEAAGIAVEEGLDRPFGPLALLADAPELASDEEAWMCARPVHLRPDRDQLLLFAGSGVDPDRAEADALVDAFNAHFAADGIRLVAPVASRWFLRSEEPLGLRTCPLAEVLGRAVAGRLPQGAGARAWMRLQTEVEMLFHAHPVNRTREREGRPLISGIWAWGGGRLPNPPAERPTWIAGDHPLTLGLSRWLQVPHLSLDRLHAADLPQAGSAIIYWDQASTALAERDLAAWSQALEAFEGFAERARQQLQQGRIASMEIRSFAGPSYRLTGPHLRRFWRRARLRDHLVRPAAD